MDTHCLCSPIHPIAEVRCRIVRDEREQLAGSPADAALTRTYLITE